MLPYGVVTASDAEGVEPKVVNADETEELVPGSPKSCVATRRRRRSAKLRDSAEVVSGSRTTNSSPP